MFFFILAIVSLSITNTSTAGASYDRRVAPYPELAASTTDISWIFRSWPLILAITCSLTLLLFTTFFIPEIHMNRGAHAYEGNNSY